MTVALSDPIPAPPLERVRAIDIVKQSYEKDKILNYSWDEKLKLWIPGPLYWFYSTKTFDEHWQENGKELYRPMERLPYLPYLFHRFLTTSILFLAKSREMRVSWPIVAFAVWKCQFFERTRVIVQSQKEDKACELVKGTGAPGYARTLYENQPDWLRRLCPLVGRMEDMPANKITWANGSTLQGVPAGADQIRLYHPAIYIADEAAHMPDFQACYDAAVPVCSQIIAVSSAAPSWFGDMCSRP